MSSLHELAEAVAAAADALNDPTKLDQTLAAILGSAADAVKGFDQAAISVVNGRGGFDQRAARGELAVELDRIQLDLGEGPMPHVLSKGTSVVVRQLRYEQRFAAYVERAVQLGVVAQISARLQFDDTAVLGCLNLYATADVFVDDEAESLVEVFAAQAAVAVGGAAVVSQLNEALSTRKVIGQALGILMERYAMSEARALAYLRRESSHRNIKLRALAAELVDMTGRTDAQPD